MLSHIVYNIQIHYMNFWGQKFQIRDVEDENLKHLCIHYTDSLKSSSILKMFKDSSTYTFSQMFWQFERKNIEKKIKYFQGYEKLTLLSHIPAIYYVRFIVYNSTHTSTDFLPNVSCLAIFVSNQHGTSFEWFACVYFIQTRKKQGGLDNCCPFPQNTLHEKRSVVYMS